MNFKLKTWVTKVKLRAQIDSAETRKTASFFKTSIISIIIGFLLTSILIMALGVNPIDFFMKSFNVVFTRSINFENFMAWSAVYMLFGIGLAIGFKVGLFNMSGSGQAILSMGITGLMLISLFGDQAGINKAGPEILVLILVVMVVMSMMLSAITGILKVVFNIHEVATSILLNWTIWYLMKWAFAIKGFNSSTPMIPTSWILELGGSKWLLPLIITIIVFVSAWIILTFTTIGYKFKLVGTQKDAAAYVGINYKAYIVSATALQGLCIGLGSFVYWVSLNRGYSMNTDTIPTIGFDAIAISLIAFNNILGIIPIAILWAVLQVGMPAAVPTFPGMGREIAPLVFGFIVYSSTFSSLFLRLKIISWFKFKIYLFKDIETKKEVVLKRQEIKAIKKEMKVVRKEETEGFAKFFSRFKKQNVENTSIAELGHEKLILLKRKINVLNDEIDELREIGYIKYEEKSYKSIKKGFSKKRKAEVYALLNTAIQELNVVEEEKDSALSKIKKIKKDKDLSKDEKLTAINEQKLYLEKVKKINEKINVTWKEIIDELNVKNGELLSQRDANLKLAKEELSTITLGAKELPNEEKRILKFKTLMELGEKYGCN